jgi:aspartate/methionine/tyrosine aminotransferase
MITKAVSIPLKNTISSKLREVSNWLPKANPLLYGNWSPDLPSQAVIDAIVDAMQDENAQYQSYQGLPELREGMADFMPKN